MALYSIDQLRSPGISRFLLFLFRTFLELFLVHPLTSDVYRRVAEWWGRGKEIGYLAHVFAC